MRETTHIPLDYSKSHWDIEREDRLREELTELAESSRLRSEAISRAHSTLEPREEQRRSFIKSGMTGTRQRHSEAREKGVEEADDGGADTGECRFKVILGENLSPTILNNHVMEVRDI